MSLSRVFFCFSLLSWFGLLAASEALAFRPDTHPEELAPIDKRSKVNPELTPSKKAALAKLKGTVPDARVTFNEKLGTPSWVASPKSLLTGPRGFSKSTPAAGANVLAENTPHRAVKVFLNEHSGLYGYNANVLDNAKVVRSYAAAHNGVQTTVWEQQVQGISVYESVLIGHVTANQELINLASTFVSDPTTAAMLVMPASL